MFFFFVWGVICVVLVVLCLFPFVFYFVVGFTLLSLFLPFGLDEVLKQGTLLSVRVVGFCSSIFSRGFSVFTVLITHFPFHGF